MFGKKYIGEGIQGKCYELKNGIILKKFKYPRDIEDIEKFKYFLEYQNDSFMFPFDFIYNKRNFHGYFCKKALGKSLGQTFKDSNLIKMAENSQKLEEDINKVSDGKIRLYDIRYENILYDQNKLSVIDPDEFSHLDYLTTDQVKRDNNNQYRSLIVNLFLRNLQFNEQSFKLYRIDDYRRSNIPVSEIIYRIKRDLDRYYNVDIQTLDELKKR